MRRAKRSRSDGEGWRKVVISVLVLRRNKGWDALASDPAFQVGVSPLRLWGKPPRRMQSTIDLGILLTSHIREPLGIDIWICRVKSNVQ